ncbi:DGQHR domain-containing protein [Microbacterium karelineae]|uniref:DGQHR domain-containing protein n=1 Tax=Microbacterium karelineae TaxID=2654283 RepID=UPI0012EA99EF|nr:DGQHR domain-containing protein [Microbacterium karelineae]
MSEPIELLPIRQVRREITRRLDGYLREKIPNARQGEYENSGDGWVLDKTLKNSVWMRKPKRHDVAFEDRVWAMCARLGFNSLSLGRTLQLPYGKGDNERKQVNVLAADDEVVLVIDCKSSGGEQPRTETFKPEIEAINGYRTGLIGALRKQFPGHKIKFAFITNNIYVSKDTLAKMGAADIAYLDEEAVNYYHELADHLGPAAKFQLLGNLFHGQKIEAMDATVPAIRGKMGGYTYYSFAIEPERLLKLAYVLHRNNANMRWMPTYQRIIKRSRLKKVSEFVEDGGFFPNSLVINVDNGGRPLRFDRSEKQSGSTTLGLLHLPPKYRSVYIVDGQHRLFGYAHSSRAHSELVPVVAFVDMPGTKQLEMFMDINENQQAVPKNLRLTLKADLEWESSDKKRQAQALKLKVAQLLGEQKSSPLRGRVIIGEEKANERLCISLDAVGRGVDRGRFIGEFTSTEMRKPGSFYRGSIDTTIDPLIGFLELCFAFMRDELPSQWNKGRGEGGFVFTNAGVEAILRLLGDFIDHLSEEGKADPRQQTPNDVFVQVRSLLSHLVTYLNGLTPDEIATFRTWLGAGGPTKYLRQFQSAIVETVPNFEPEGYEEWKLNQEKQFNADSYTMLNEVETFLRQDIKRRLQDKHGSEWIHAGVPQAIFRDGSTRAAEKQYEAGPGVTVDWWDCLYLIDYQKVMQHGGNAVWLELFDRTYTLPSDRKAAWRNRSGWFNELNRTRNKVAHNEAVTEEEFGFLQTLHSHFDLGGTGRNS